MEAELENYKSGRKDQPKEKNHDKRQQTLEKFKNWRKQLTPKRIQKSG
jgi:hypothetical protein